MLKGRESSRFPSCPILQPWGRVATHWRSYLESTLSNVKKNLLPLVLRCVPCCCPRLMNSSPMKKRLLKKPAACVKRPAGRMKRPAAASRSPQIPRPQCSVCIQVWCCSLHFEHSNHNRTFVSLVIQGCLLGPLQRRFQMPCSLVAVSSSYMMTCVRFGFQHTAVMQSGAGLSMSFSDLLPSWVWIL